MLPLVPDRVIVILVPCKVAAVVLPGLFKSPEVTLAPAITWYNNTCVNTASAGTDPKSAKASFVGAKTVKSGFIPSALPPSVRDKIAAKSVAGVKVVNAETKVEKLGSAVANVTTVGMPITASTAWIIPFVPTTSALATVEIPLNLTPLLVLKYKLIAFPPAPIAPVFV